MQLEAERELVVAYGRKLVEAGLTTGTGGNLSVFRRDLNLIAISPSGMDYFQIRPEDVPLVSPDGRIVEGTRKPSSELSMHLALYRARPDVAAVVHTHSPFATTLACLHWEIPPVHYLVAFSGKKVPVAPYATYGTEALAANAAQAAREANAVLLANHGLVTVGRDLPQAFATAEQVEFVAQIYYRTRCAGEPVLLTDEQMDDALARLATYGQQPQGGGVS